MAENVVINFEANTQPIKQAQKDIENLSKEGQKGVAGLSDSFKDLGAGIAAAVSVGAIISFSKECVTAFAKAEAQTNALRFAIEKVGKMGEKVFQDLVKQSKELAKISFFDDEDIQTAQKFLVQVGLNANEVKKLTPLILDLAAAQGTTLTDAAEKAVNAINGQTRGLKDVGANFKDTGTKVGNYNALVTNLTKIQGAATDALNTTEGALKKNAVEVENLQESIGSRLAPILVKLKDIALGAAGALLDLIAPEKVDNIEQIAKILRADKSNTNESLQAEERKANLLKIQLEAHLKIKESEDKHFGFTVGTLDEYTKIKDQIQQQKDTQAAINKILQERKSIPGATTNANSLSGQDAAARNAAAAEEASKHHQQFQDNLKKDVNDYEASQNDMIDAMFKRIDKEEEDKKKKMTGPGRKEFEQQQEEIGKIDFKIGEQKKKDAESLAKQIQDIQFQIGEETAAGLFDILKAGIDNQIELVSKQRDEENKAIDDKLKANQDAADRELISKKDFMSTEKKLLDQKTANETAAQKKINDLKHKGDVNERIQKLFNIAIATAQGVINYGNNPLTAPLIPYVIALGAAQAAFVAAAPLPKYHKGRLASYSSSEELAIIRKDETITNPQKSKEYHPSLAAIHKGSVPAQAMNSFVRNFRMSDFSGGRSLNSFDYVKNASELEWQLRGQNKAVTKRLERIEQAILSRGNSASDLRRA